MNHLEKLLLSNETILFNSYGNWSIERSFRREGSMFVSKQCIMLGHGGESALRAWLEKRAGSQPKGEQHGKVKSTCKVR